MALRKASGRSFPSLMPRLLAYHADSCILSFAWIWDDQRSVFSMMMENASTYGGSAAAQEQKGVAPTHVHKLKEPRGKKTNKILFECNLRSWWNKKNQQNVFVVLAAFRFLDF